MNKRISFLSLISLSLLTSCGIDKVPDLDKLIIGSFPIVQTQDGQQFDHYLYVDFLNRGEEHKEKNYDLEICLNNKGFDTKYSSSVDSLGNKARFINLADYVSRFTLFSNLTDFINLGGYFVFYTSVGKMAAGVDSFLSSPLTWTRSGVVLSIGVNEEPNQELPIKVGQIYKEVVQ